MILILIQLVCWLKEGDKDGKGKKGGKKEKKEKKDKKDKKGKKGKKGKDDVSIFTFNCLVIFVMFS